MPDFLRIIVLIHCKTAVSRFPLVLMGANVYARECSRSAPPIRRSLARNAAGSIIGIVLPISTGRLMNPDGNAPYVQVSKVKCTPIDNSELDGLAVCL